MSRELISSEKFPPKPHNCECLRESHADHVSWFLLTKLANRLSGPAVKVPGLVFCAGQTATGEIRQATRVWLLESLTDARITYLQRAVLQNLKEVLELAGSSLEKVVKYNVYLADMKDFAAMNEVYIDFLPNPKPSRSCLQALAPGKGTVIEIECIAQA
ncbi:Protein mmf2, mitochondrial [Tolypocladium paradoxum]|uniref:Protein mmf2, mitochondrial n=1 Tax=Tolypocladium paradoxum TaxID=94208 RepID=A0A2S4KLM3_9HYPO|nr:Protein mmf2, mitochondrial [Tolypocladium paradoxum]